MDDLQQLFACHPVLEEREKGKGKDGGKGASQDDPGDSAEPTD